MVASKRCHSNHRKKARAISVGADQNHGRATTVGRSLTTRRYCCYVAHEPPDHVSVASMNEEMVVEFFFEAEVPYSWSRAVDRVICVPA